MRKILALIVCLIIPWSSGEAINRVQICYSAHNASTPQSCNLLPGDTVIACVRDDTTHTPVVTDNLDTLISGGYVLNAFGTSAVCYYAQNVTGGTTQFSVSGQGAWDFLIVEYSPTGVFDVASSSAPQTQQGTSLTSNPFTTTGTGDLIFAFWGNAVENKYSGPGTNYTAVTANVSGMYAAEEWIGATAGSHVASWITTGGSIRNVVSVLSFLQTPLVAASSSTIFMSEF